MWKLKSNKIQMSLPSSIMSSFVKEYAIFELPFFIEDRDHMASIENNVFPKELYAAAQKKGLYVLALWENGYRHISNNIRPIHTPEDLQGLRIRTPRSVWRKKMFTNWGANVTSLGFSEVYDAIESGVVDGQENPYTNIWNANLQEVQTYISTSAHVYSPGFLTVSKRWFDLQDEETKDIMQETAREMSTISRRMGENDENELIIKLKESGVIFNDVDREAFIETSRIIYEEFSQSIPLAKTLIKQIEALKK